MAVPMAVRRQIGAELRRLREGARVSQVDAAAKIGRAQPRISQIERGERAPTVAELRVLMELYGVSQDTDELINLLASSRNGDWWATRAADLPKYATRLLELERTAQTVRVHAIDLVPGLLQTADYARTLLRITADLRGISQDVERRVAIRMERQDVLTRDEPVTLEAVIGEAALLRPVGGPEVIGDQLRHLATMAARENITVQLLPFSAGAHLAMGAPFTLLRFADQAQPDLLYLENFQDGYYVEAEGDTQRYNLVFGRLQDAALSADASHQLLLETAKLYQL